MEVAFGHGPTCYSLLCKHSQHCKSLSYLILVDETFLLVNTVWWPPQEREILWWIILLERNSLDRARKSIIGVNWIRLSLMNSTLIAWQGLVITGVSFYLQSWCIEKKGPVFAAIFTPLALVFTMLCSTIFLGEMIYLGRWALPTCFHSVFGIHHPIYVI